MPQDIHAVGDGRQRHVCTAERQPDASVLPTLCQVRRDGVSNTTLSINGDAGHPCANPIRTFVGRVSDIPGAANRTVLSIILASRGAQRVGE